MPGVLRVQLPEPRHLQPNLGSEAGSDAGHAAVQQHVRAVLRLQAAHVDLQVLQVPQLRQDRPRLPQQNQVRQPNQFEVLAQKATKV